MRLLAPSGATMFYSRTVCPPNAPSPQRGDMCKPAPILIDLVVFFNNQISQLHVHTVGATLVGALFHV